MGAIFQTWKHTKMLILSSYVVQACINIIYKIIIMVTIGRFSEMYNKFLFLGLGVLYLRFETCLECIIWHVCSYLRHKHKLLILSPLSGFMTCNTRFNIPSEGSISQLWNTA